MTRKKLTQGLGMAIRSDQRRSYERQQAEQQKYVGVPEEKSSGSVLEQTSLEDLLATVELKKQDYLGLVGEAEVVDEGPILIESGFVSKLEASAQEHRNFLSIPRRPKFVGLTVDELAYQEAEAFMEWRRQVASSTQDMGLELTPYERNLDFWRQLWRCVERSDLLVQVVDARDPEFYRCQDLSRYVREVDATKRVMILVNKSDFHTAEQRKRWADYYTSIGVDALFFSALREVERQVKIDHLTHSNHSCTEPNLQAGETREDAEEEGLEEDLEDSSPVLGPSKDSEAPDLADCVKLLEELRDRLKDRTGTVGFVGHPNVGKSTVINALMGAKRVAMSRTPGKTKHIQTLELPDQSITLCDCPGLVFPSVVATKSHLVISNTVPLEDLRDCFAPISLIVERIGFEAILQRYACAAFVRDATLRSGATGSPGSHTLDFSHTFLAALATRRNHFLRIGVPDENWAARRVLRDYVRGALLYCEPPPGGWAAVDSGPETALSSMAKPVESCKYSVDNEDEFLDLDEAIQAEVAASGGRGERNMTKRRARAIDKRLLKGKLPATGGYGGSSAGLCLKGLRGTQPPI